MVSIADPNVMMQAAASAELEPIALEARQRLERVAEALAGSKSAELRQSNSRRPLDEPSQSNSRLGSACPSPTRPTSMPALK